ncbi:efflux RND transporter periplasmic adaptor subunit [Pseudochryseolinea flava]|uniref:Efflux transporter periplasmic adaptor subunit n=1 Tax=Pseudochryseolinea flava TaxID=2059302 RepID=A0A364XU54_9BACT|nr:efflux RND transporter periplasmic adaptor subunit [Pseudochryseolinea flava]RAV97844.1 efflux transporter periplasmic adaptor subunit [Pseudochryseolinea flava]
MAKQTKNSNRTLKRVIIGIVVVIGVLVIAKMNGWIGKTSDIEVELSKAKRVTITERVSASGTVQPVTEVKLAPEVSGEIRELLVEEGDSVKKGQLLVKIRPDTWVSQAERAEAALNQQRANQVSSEAALSRAEATYIRAQQEFKRQEKLWNEKVISEADWQLAQQNFKIAENDLKSAKQSLEAGRFIVKSSEASLREAQENVRLTSVLAPMDGIVSKLSVKKGERVVGTQTMAGTEMLRIADLNAMEVRVNVNENDIVRVQVGNEVAIDVDAYSSQKKEFKGKVTLIANTAKDKVSADAITEFEVRILIDNESYKDLAQGKVPFRPGMTASVDIMTQKKENILSVPLAAVTTRNPDKKEEGKDGPPSDEAQNSDKPKPKGQDQTVVFVNQGGTAKMIEVKTGISDYDNIEIVSGVADSTEVITGPFLAVSKRLKDGDKIKTQPKPESKPKTAENK